MAKNQNTLAKRQREFEKRRKAEEKRQRRNERKTADANPQPQSMVTVDPDAAELPSTESRTP